MNRRAWIVTSWVLHECESPTLKRVLTEYTVAAFQRMYPRKDPSYVRKRPNPLSYREWIEQAWENVRVVDKRRANATRRDFRVLELVLRRGLETAVRIRPAEKDAIEASWKKTVELFRAVLGREIPVPAAPGHRDYPTLWGFHPEKFMQ